jgi:pimeloyl-ACP methyl ester carboxylesterase
MIRGVAIPGLGMAAAELPDISGLVRLENPEIGDGPRLGDESYSLGDLARGHADWISRNVPADSELWVIGMSMGGMIASILASELRGLLPNRTHFLFLVTSANTGALPAISDDRLASWQVARPGSVESFRMVMTPFFSPSFMLERSQEAETYFRYRASGGNRQSPKAFLRQVAAIRGFDGGASFGRLDPAEATFVTGDEDLVLGPPHGRLLRELLPRAKHLTLPRVGHMINIERSEIFAPWEAFR